MTTVDWSASKSWTLAAAREASGPAFQLAMGVGAGLMFVGAAVAGIGIRDRPRRPARVEEGNP